MALAASSLAAEKPCPDPDACRSSLDLVSSSVKGTVDLHGGSDALHLSCLLLTALELALGRRGREMGGRWGTGGRETSGELERAHTPSSETS